jgi:hypothetical protein
LLQLNETSLSQLRRDHETDHLEHKIAQELGEDEEMSEDEKSTGPNLSAAERKALRAQEAQEAIADHEEAQKAFQENRERLRNERLVREAAEGPIVAPTPETARRYADRTRPIFNQDPERAPSSRPKNRWRGARDIGRDADQPSGFWKGLARRSPREIGSAVDWRGQTVGQKAGLTITKPARAAPGAQKQAGETHNATERNIFAWQRCVLKAGPSNPQHKG